MEIETPVISARQKSMRVYVTNEAEEEEEEKKSPLPSIPSIREQRRSTMHTDISSVKMKYLTPHHRNRAGSAIPNYLILQQVLYIQN